MTLWDLDRVFLLQGREITLRQQCRAGFVIVVRHRAGPHAVILRTPDSDIGGISERPPISGDQRLRSRCPDGHVRRGHAGKRPALRVSRSGRHRGDATSEECLQFAHTIRHDRRDLSVVLPSAAFANKQPRRLSSDRSRISVRKASCPARGKRLLHPRDARPHVGIQVSIKALGEEGSLVAAGIVDAA